jgi:hypothetical protein
MRKRKEKEQSNVQMLRLDPKVEKAIYNKRDAFLTFVTRDVNGQPQSNQFSIIYHPEIDTYEFCDDPTAKARFLATIYYFTMGGGVVTVRTFLDDISHQRYLPDGRSMAVPFSELRMFHSDGNKVDQVDVINVFLATITDHRTGQINLNAIDKSEFFCDEKNRFSSAEMLETLKKMAGKNIL